MRSLQEQIDDVDKEIKDIAKELLSISDIDDKKYYREKEMKLRDVKRLFLEKELLQLKHTSGQLFVVVDESNASAAYDDDDDDDNNVADDDVNYLLFFSNTSIEVTLLHK